MPDTILNDGKSKNPLDEILKRHGVDDAHTFLKAGEAKIQAANDQARQIREHVVNARLRFM